MSPSILVHKDKILHLNGNTFLQTNDRPHKVKLVGGASGGPRIITATAQVILKIIGLGISVLPAVIQPRYHHQLVPYLLYAENHIIGVLKPTDISFMNNIINSTTFNPLYINDAKKRMKYLVKGNKNNINFNMNLDRLNILEQNYGHNISYTTSTAITQFISISSITGEMTAIADPRKGGIPSGVNF